MSELLKHAEAELTRSKFLGEKADHYDKMVGEAVLELLKVFSQQGHSGFSADVTLDLFAKLADWKTLAPLTNDPNEWMYVAENIWQNKRQSSAFSNDGGATYHDVDDPLRMKIPTEMVCIRLNS
jgi:hypothetical protein